MVVRWDDSRGCYAATGYNWSPRNTEDRYVPVHEVVVTCAKADVMQ